MHGHAHEKLLRKLNHFFIQAFDQIAVGQRFQTDIVKQVIAFRFNISAELPNFFLRVMLEDIGAVPAHVRQVSNQRIKVTIAKMSVFTVQTSFFVEVVYH
ncbi:hypothetical protein D3C81_2060860 [compost metagenome]